MRRYFTALAIAASFGVLANTADATVVSFYLKDIQLTDRLSGAAAGAATGTFSLDESDGLVTAMNIYYKGVTAGVPSYHFTDTDLTFNGFYPASPEGYEFACDMSKYSGCVSATGGGSWFGAADWLYFGIGPSYGFLELDIAAPAAGSPDLDTDASVSNGAAVRYAIVPSDAAIVPVPEPATWAIMLLGVFGMGAVLRGARRKPLAAVTAA
jgi:hypothetical protein